MHILDSYSLSSGSKISKPFIFEQFFPLPCEKYITFQAQSKYEGKDYNLFQDVINILFPILERNGIKIVQIGIPNEQPHKYCIDLRGKTDFGQLAYIIRNSLLHLGPDSLGIHIASSYDIPLVGLYSVSPSSVSGPYWGTKEKQVCFDAYQRVGNGKPSYSDKEHPKSINTIKPEEIAQSVLNLLNIKQTIDFTTIFVGEQYNSKVFRELIPKSPIQLTNPEIPIEIRMDLNFDENFLAQQLNLCRAIIFTNKPINLDILQKFKPNIFAVTYIVENDNDNPEFCKQVRNLGVQVSLYSFLSQEEIDKKKIFYYEIDRINQAYIPSSETKQLITQSIDSLYFRSNKLVFEENKVFMGHTARDKGEEGLNDFTYQKLVISPELWKELPFMMIVKKN